MFRVGLVALAALACAPLAAAGEAFPVDLHLRVDGSVSFAHAFDGTLHLAGATYAAPGDFHAGDAVALTLRAEGARVAVFRDPILRARAPGVLWVDDADPRDAAEAESFPFTGTVEVRPDRDDATVLVLPSGSGTLGMEARGLEGLRLQAPGAWSTQRGGQEPSYPWMEGHGFRPRLPAAFAEEAPERFLLEGDVLAVAYGSTVRLAGPDGVRTIQTGLVRQQSAGAPAYAQAESMESVLVVVEAAAAQAEARGAARAWELRVDGLEGSTAGELGLVGTRDLGSEPALPSAGPSLLQVVGDLSVQAARGNGTMDWAIQGSATYVGVDGQAAFGSRGVPWVAAAGGLGLLALVLYGLRQAMGLMGYHKAEPLESVTRAKLFLLAGETPGITVSALSRALGVRRPTVFFHARALQRAGLLSVHREGRRWHFAQSGRAPAPAFAGAASPSSALAAVQQPVRRAIVDCLAQAGQALPAARVRDLLAQRQVDLSPSHLAYHLSVLERSGAVGRSEQGGRLVYRRALGAAAPPAAGPWHGALSAKEASALRQAADDLASQGALSGLALPPGGRRAGVAAGGA